MPVINFDNNYFVHSGQFWFLVWIANIVAGACAGSGKQATWYGALLGALMGPLGVVAALGLDRRSRCPVCAGRLDATGKESKYMYCQTLCQHCRSPLYWAPGTRIPNLYKPDESGDKEKSSR